MKTLYALLLCLFTSPFLLAQSLTITSVTPTTLCIGSQITVTYTFTGNIGQVVYLQLSRTSNIYYITIGQDNANGPTGTITATIPYSLENSGVFATGEYTVKVMATLRYVPTESPASSPFTVYNTPSPKTPAGLTRYCRNDVAVSLASSVTATVNAPVNYYSPGSLIPSSQPPIPPTGELDTLYYRVTHTLNGCESLGSSVGIGITNCNLVEGYQAGGAKAQGSLNTTLGTRAGQSLTNGSYNTFIGSSAGKSNTIASANVFIGNEAGFSNTTGGANVFVGHQAGQNTTIGSENTFVGTNAGKSNTDGSFNLFVGGNAGQANTTGRENLFFGAGSGYTNTTGRFNTFVGLNSGYSTTTGENNVFFGQRAGFSNTNGNFNMFLGASTGYTNTTGVFNTFVGNGSGYSNQTGNNNTFIGLNSGFKTTTSDNVSIGYNAGLENTTGTQNTFIGTGAGVSASNPALTNATAIGYGAQVAASNSVVLGSNANVGIGTSAPAVKLHITTGMAGTSGLRLENLTSSSTASVTNQNKFLTVDGSGNVILGSLNGSAREGATDALWQRKGAFLESSQGEAIIIGQGVSKTPAGYSLFVGQGLLAEKVKVAIKNTSEWSDYVFKPGYILQSLTQVEQYIQEHQHLPGVPSAIEMVEYGNDLHKTDAKLLEKIEELTLYSIQLEKQLQANDKKHQAEIQASTIRQQKEIDELKQLVKQLLDKK